MFHPIRKRVSFLRPSQARLQLVTVKTVVSLIVWAYNQGYWDGCHANDKRTKRLTRPQGLKKHLEREVKWLR